MIEQADLRVIARSIGEYMPDINSIPGLLLYAVFAYLLSMCCLFCSSRLGGDIDIQKAMK